MMGCTLPLVAEYRDSFRYVIDVLKTLKQMRERSFPTLPELELNRLSNPFQTRRPHYPGFNAILRLMQQIPRLERICETLDPEQGGERMTPILENLPKLSLYGFVPAELLEILLIVVGLVWYWQSGSNTESGNSRRRHGSHGGSDKSSSNEGQIYCHECGKRAQPSDKFCRACGVRLRREDA